MMTQLAMPSRSRLWICWMVLMTMTGLSLWVGEPQSLGRLSLIPVFVLLAAAAVKATQILWVFLNLSRSTKTWKVTFLAFLGVILAIVLSCAALTPMISNIHTATVGSRNIR
jgi:heme/copper-type cytochrome/quinol oxidase subunit 4